MKIQIIFNDFLGEKRDIYIADNENNTFTFNNQKLQGDINRFIYEVLDLSYNWKENYVNPNIQDGLTFSLTITKDNVIQKDITCQNAFPDNFYEFLDLLNEVRENGRN